MRIRSHIVIAILFGVCVSTQAQSTPVVNRLSLEPEMILWSFPENTWLRVPEVFEPAQKPPSHYQSPRSLTATYGVKSNFLDRFSIESIRTPF